MPKNTNDKHKASYIPYRCDAETYETICKVAHANNLSLVEVLRSFVTDGMVKQGYKQDEDALRASMQAALKEVLQPQVERLAAIGAKAAQLSGAAYFLLVYVARMYFPEDSRDMIDDVAAQARQLGVEYLKLRQGMDIDDFIKGGVRKMAENDVDSILL
jgi:hypothetical protein